MKDLKKRFESVTEHEKDILGRPNFTCMKIANRLRKKGFNIPPKAESEQAAVIWSMLEFYKEHGENWSKQMNEYLQNED